MNIKLVKLTPEYKDQLFDMMGEWLAAEQHFSPYMIRRNDYRNFEYYLENLEIKEETDGRVPDSTFFCLDTDRNIFVGAVNIRHYLNDELRFTGGHIGDGIRPSERRKGYATAMIGLALEECRKLGIDRVLMTCDKDNIGSAKSIQKNGGILENEVLNEDGVWEQRYWIDLKPRTRVLFVRHAEPVQSHADNRTRPLTEQGWRDTALVMETLKHERIDAFYCSTFQRSLDTIRCTAVYFDIPIRTDERFREREAGPGGNDWEQADNPLKHRWEDFTWHEPGGESLGEVQQRNMEALREVLSANEGKTIVIGTHGTALSTIFHSYNPKFGMHDFLRIVDWMPYIVEMDFVGQELAEVKELAYLVKPYKK